MPELQNQNHSWSLSTCSNLPPIFTIDRRDSPIGTLIEDFKFNSNRALAKPLSEIISQVLPTIKDNVVIVPLPTNTKHIRARGLDHTLLLAKKLAKLRGKNYSVAQILLRGKNTTQVGTNKKQRLSQAKEAYILNPKIKVNPQNTYLLLDDVWTTGASMKSALKKLREAGASKIILLVLAVS